MTDPPRPHVIAAGDVRPGDVIAIGDDLLCVGATLVGETVEPGGVPTVYLGVEFGWRPHLATDPVRIVTDLDGRADMTAGEQPDLAGLELERPARLPAQQDPRTEVERRVGAAVLDAWPASRDVSTQVAGLYLAVVVAYAFHGRPVTVAEISGLVEQAYGTLDNRLRAWADEGIVARLGEGGPADPYRYRPTAADPASVNS